MSIDRGAYTGASPLTRGKRKDEDGKTAIRGRIPAHAGKTDAGLDRLDHLGAHPRSRGENERLVLIALSEAGASPLTRGKQDR